VALEAGVDPIEYDPVDNRLGLVTGNGSTSYACETADRLTSVDGTTYTWDTVNRLASANVDGAVSTFEYNGLGHPVSARATRDGQTH
jgi:YD repeat-containing protein